MQPWTVERGTLWVWEASHDLPPPYPVRVDAQVQEIEETDLGDLTVAMELAGPEPIRRRLEAGRRCVVLKIGGQIATYGWVTQGVESVGELERNFNLCDDEAYIWDCATVPAWRGQRLFSALLSRLIARLASEGVQRIWIGASRHNRPSIRAFANAGFQPVVDVVYRRVYRLTTLWLEPAPSVERPLLLAAYRILTSPHERRFGRLAVGIKR